MTKISLKIVYGISNTEIQILTPRETPDVLNLYNTINHLINYDSVEIPCYDGYDIISVPLSKITHFFSMDKKVYTVYEEQTLEIKKRLYEIEDFLTKKNFSQFIRVSKNSIVNFDYVKKIDMNLSGSIYIILESEEKIPISRRYYSKIKDFLNKSLESKEE